MGAKLSKKQVTSSTQNRASCWRERGDYVNDTDDITTIGEMDNMDDGMDTTTAAEITNIGSEAFLPMGGDAPPMSPSSATSPPPSPPSVPTPSASTDLWPPAFSS